MKILSTILEYKQFIFGAFFIILIILLLNQCEQNKELKQKIIDSEFINNQNIEALNDTEIQLKLTLDQLKIVDKSLYDAKLKIDSLYDIKSKVITKTEIQYIEKDIRIQNSLIYDTVKNAYGLNFNSIDNFKKIKGTSFFRVHNNNSNIEILSDSTIIHENSVRFALVFSEYLDDESKMSKVKMASFYLKENNELGNQIPEDVLSIAYRNAEILNKPYEFNNDLPPTQNSNLKIQRGFAITFNPLAFGMYPLQSGGYNIGWTPNIGIGYYITIRK